MRYISSILSPPLYTHMHLCALGELLELAVRTCHISGTQNGVISCPLPAGSVSTLWNYTARLAITNLPDSQPLGWGQSNQLTCIVDNHTNILTKKKRPDTSNSTSGVQCGRMHGVSRHDGCKSKATGSRRPAGHSKQVGFWAQPG